MDVPLLSIKATTRPAYSSRHRPTSSSSSPTARSGKQRQHITPSPSTERSPLLALMAKVEKKEEERIAPVSEKCSSLASSPAPTLSWKGVFFLLVGHQSCQYMFTHVPGIGQKDFQVSSGLRVSGQIRSHLLPVVRQASGQGANVQQVRDAHVLRTPVPSGRVAGAQEHVQWLKTPSGERKLEWMRGCAKKMRECARLCERV